MGKFLNRLIFAGVIALGAAAVCQELEKPKEERRWHGKVACIVPYDFRMPTIERIKSSYWNPATERVFTPEVFGLGWAINFFALFEKLRVINDEYLAEEDYLMPTPRIKELMEKKLKATKELGKQVII